MGVGCLGGVGGWVVLYGGWAGSGGAECLSAVYVCWARLAAAGSRSLATCLQTLIINPPPLTATCIGRRGVGREGMH